FWFFGNFRETRPEKKNRTNDSRWIVRQAVRAGCYAHDDADTARHSGHDTTKTKALIFIGALSAVSCFVRVVMSVDPRHVGTASHPPFSCSTLADAGRRWPTPGARRSLGNDERRHHPEHPLAGLGVRQDVAVECPGARVVALHDYVPPLARRHVQGVATPW